MANRDVPRGLRALRNRNGAFPPVGKYDMGVTTIYEGQLVLLNTTGLAMAVTATLASGITNCLGVAAHYATAATAAAKKIQVYNDPNQLFVAQSDDATLDSRTDYLGRNFTLTGHQSGNTTTLQSKGEIDGSTGTSIATSSAAHIVQVVDKWNRVGNVVTTGGTASSNGEFIVRINSRFHLYANSIGKGV